MKASPSTWLAVLACPAAALALALSAPAVAQVAAPVATAPAAAAPAAAPGAGPVKSAGSGKSAVKPAVASDNPMWKDLSAPQKSALLPLAGEWDRMDKLRKQKWLDIGNRFASMNPDEQSRVHERMREWLTLTPEQRKLARENYASTKKIDKTNKSAQWEQYQQLPEEEKKKLAADAVKKKQAAALPKSAVAKPGVPPLKAPAGVPAVPATSAASTSAAPAPAAAPTPAPAPAVPNAK